MADNLGRDVREVFDDIRPALRATADDLQSRIHTIYPLEIVDFDKKKITATVKIQTKSTIRKEDGSIEKKEIPEIKDVPVYYPCGGREDDQQQQGGQGGGGAKASEGGGQQKKKGYMLTFPLKKGDECIGLVFSRAIDKWYDKSGIQEQGMGRMHHISDMALLPGMKSKPRAEEVKDGIDDKGSQLRSVNGDHKYGLDENEDGGLYSNTTEHIKNKADKNMENEAGEDMSHKAKNMSRETEKIEQAKAGKAIVKNAPKILLNSKSS